MRALALPLAALLLAGCESSGNRGADGYVFGEPEFTQTDVRVRLVMHDNVRALQMALPAGNVAAGSEAKAWGRVWPAAKTCEVHIVDPAKDYAPEWIGHEITHCFFGRWHEQGEFR